jgi:hypothetical protein
VKKVADMEPEKSIMEEIIRETKQTYSRMSLLELLAEENMMTEFLHRRSFDPIRKRLQEILRSEVERKLR